jgi:hypothetical protein
MIAMSAPGPLGFLGAGLLAQHTGSVTASLLLVAVAATLGALIVVTRQDQQLGKGTIHLIDEST